MDVVKRPVLYNLILIDFAAFQIYRSLSFLFQNKNNKNVDGEPWSKIIVVKTSCV